MNWTNSQGLPLPHAGSGWFKGWGRRPAALWAGVSMVLAVCGGCSGNGATSSSAASMSLLAGYPWGPGSADGTGVAASFSFSNFNQAAVASDNAGNVYVADADNRTIRKITPAGAVTTLAGAAGVIGSADGAGSSARFGIPSGIATDAAGNIYVGDYGNHTIRKISPAGVVTTIAGTAGLAGSVDGTGSAARFLNPAGVGVDGAGNVYVVDHGNHTVRRINPAGVVSTLAGTAGVSGSADGIGAAARFNGPMGLAVDRSGNVYVADSGNYTVRKMTPAGVVTTLAGTAGVMGSANGAGATASFSNAFGVAVDSTENVYVADGSNNLIRKITPAGFVSTVAGTAGAEGSTDGTGAAARFSGPTGVSVDGAGNVYVADSGNNIVRKISPADVVSTLAGSVGLVGSANGTGIAARFNTPGGLSTDSAGNIYAADIGNCVVRKITPAGVVSSLAGVVGVLGRADGAGSAATFDCPNGVAVDRAGYIYVADTSNSTIRKITPTGVVSTLAGLAGVTGSADGTGSSARFNNPGEVAVDTAGNVYVADTLNYTVRKISPAGVVTTLAGMAGVPGSTDGTGSAARFRYLRGVAVDSAANIYVTDSADYTVRKITPAGVVTTLAGLAGTSGFADGTGAAARFSILYHLVVDGAGNIYVADNGNSIVRKVSPAGVVTTVVGTPGLVGYTPGHLPGVLSAPTGIALYGTTLYVATASAAVVQVTNLE